MYVRLGMHYIIMEYHYLICDLTFDAIPHVFVEEKVWRTSADTVNYHSQ